MILGWWRELVDPGVPEIVQPRTLLRMVRIGLAIDVLLACGNILTRFFLGPSADVGTYDIFLAWNLAGHLVVIAMLIWILTTSGELAEVVGRMRVGLAASAWTTVIASWIIGGMTVTMNLAFAVFLVCLVRLFLGGKLGQFCFFAVLISDAICAVLRIAGAFPDRSPLPDYVLDNPGRAIATMVWRSIALGVMFVVASFIANRGRISEHELRTRNAELERRVASQSRLFDERSPIDVPITDPPDTGATASAPVASIDKTLPVPHSRTPLELTPMKALGRYEILGRIGSGAMGLVYEARDTELDRIVALKIVRPRGGELANARARLRREAQVMARLSHPNVAAVFDIGQVEEQLFIAMELVRGGTLRDLVASERRWDDQLRTLVAAGRGLAAAHEAGIVHRDFKPDNVLVRLDGTVRVSDFGLARSDATPDTATFAGTPAYMAPESFDRVADALTDQFAFAATAFEVLDGQRPFSASENLDSHREALQSGARRPWRRRDVPAAVRAAIERGLSLDRSARWPSMTAFCDALERLARPDHTRKLAIAGFIAVLAAWIAITLVR